MRRARWLLLPLLLVGCKAGRQAAVSDDGRVASTVENGTFLAGRGRIAEGGSALAWSPNGQTLAVAEAKGVALWPGERRLEGLGGPLAFSPFGDRLAGVEASGVRVREIETGASKATTIEGMPDALGWTSDGRLFARFVGGLQVDGGPTLELASGGMIDAVPTPDGKIALVAWEAMPKDAAGALGGSVRLGTWNPADGGLDLAPLGKVADLFGVASARRLVLPASFALAPDGRHLAVAGVSVEAGPRSLARLRVLMAKTPTGAESQEAERLVKAARITSVVFWIDASGRSQSLWSAPLDVSKDRAGVTDLAFSPDGRWLAIAGKDGTVRVAVPE